jgi:hypothetical protein
MGWKWNRNLIRQKSGKSIVWKIFHQKLEQTTFFEIRFPR